MGRGWIRRARLATAAAIGVCGAGVVVVEACNGKKNDEVIVALQTDLALPKDVDTVRIEVTQAGRTLLARDYPVGPDGAHIPATLGVVGNPDAPGLPIKVRVIARQKDQLRVLRQATTTIPAGRTAMLRMPIHWLCWNHDQDTDAGPQPNCPDGQSCVAGKCADDAVDPATLPDFDPAGVFGGEDGGACFDTLACFSHGAYVAVDTATCTIDKPQPSQGAAGINVALVRAPDVPGICSASACLVPLDADPVEGWSELPGFPTRLQLPTSVCDRLALPATDRLAVLGIAVTTACSTKTTAIPTCGPWSSVGGDAGTFQAAPPAPLDGGSTTGDATILLPDGATCDPSVQWPKMLAAPIAAGAAATIAGLDFSKGDLTIDQAETVNCGGAPAAAIDSGYGAVTWGPNNDVFAEYSAQTRALHLVAVRGAYTGTMQLASRKNGSFGAHTYVLGVGALTRDGAPLTIDWANPNALVSELYDAFTATFDPSRPPVADCVQSGDCFANANAQTNASGIGFVPQSFFVVFPKGGSAPNELYVITDASGADGGATDAAAGGG